jgi:hypothetical protein
MSTATTRLNRVGLGDAIIMGLSSSGPAQTLAVSLAGLVGSGRLGVNGHVAFNEPGSPWDLRTHVVHLSHATRAAHERQASVPWEIPAWGVTLGIKTLLESRHILLSFSYPLGIDDLDRFNEKRRGSLEAERE